MYAEYRLSLPAGYDQSAFVDFHGRDRQSVAERIASGRVGKGFVWRGRPALMEWFFTAHQARVRLALDGAGEIAPAKLKAELKRLSRHALGLDQPVQTFNAAWCSHPKLGPLIARRPGLCIPQTLTPFEAIAWAIIGQQISVTAATAIRRRLILACEVKHSSGLWCFPAPAHLLQADTEALMAAGLSRGKWRALVALAQWFEAGQLPEVRTSEPESLEALGECLLALPGVGPWTVNYALLRGFGWLDASLHGDVAVRRNLARLLGRDDISQADTERWLRAFTPWRALVAAHLWAMST